MEVQLKRLERLNSRLAEAKPDYADKFPTYLLDLQKIIDLWLILGPRPDDIAALAELSATDASPPEVEGVPWRGSGVLVGYEELNSGHFRTGGVLRLSNKQLVYFVVPHGVLKEYQEKLVDIVGLTAGRLHSDKFGDIPCIAGYALTKGGSLSKAIVMWHGLYLYDAFVPSPEWLLSRTRRWLGLPASTIPRQVRKPDVSPSPKLTERAPYSEPPRPIPTPPSEGHMECVPRRSGGEECHFVPAKAAVPKSPGKQIPEVPKDDIDIP